jgi:hypothetical protein
MNLFKFNSQIVDITPSFPTKLFRMKGSKRHKDVYSNLESNLIHLISEDFEMFVFSIDLLFTSSELYTFIKSELQKYFDINDENILTIASHTHFSPSIERDREGLSDFDEKYFEFLKLRLAEQILGITRVQKSFVEMEAREMKSEKLTINRRRKVRTLRNYCHEFIAMEPNFKGYKNETFKIIRFIDYESKKTDSVLWFFPCHPTNFYDSSRITSEYPGAIRDFIRSIMEKVDISVVFIPGFMGEVRAAPPRRSRISKWIRNLAQLSYTVNLYKFISKIASNLMNNYKKISLFSDMEIIGYGIINDKNEIAYLLDFIVSNPIYLNEGLSSLLHYVKQISKSSHVVFWATRLNNYSSQIHELMLGFGAKLYQNNSMNFVYRNDFEEIEKTGIHNFYLNALWTEGFKI